ncbi:hypothetical protein ACOSQ3_022170 [Xanthoceras sorbifolium]
MLVCSLKPFNEHFQQSSKHIKDTLSQGQDNMRQFVPVPCLARHGRGTTWDNVGQKIQKLIPPQTLGQLLKILERKNSKGQIILPVFYHALPSDVRKQTGSYGEAFAKHEKCFKKTKDKVSNWRAALNQVANLSGWDIKEHDGPESEFIEKIVKDVLKKLKHMSPRDHLDDLVGILIIITSRYKQVLKNGVDGLYELKELNYHDALQLFCFSGFKQSNVKHLWKENQAIECLNQLVTLKLNHCKRLKNLPSNIHNLTSLRQLSLRGCSSITQFPEISRNVKFLYLDWTAIDEVPSSIEHLTKLYNLSLRNCTRLKGVSSSIFKLESLEYFYLCVLETREKLLYFDLDGTTIKELHASIELLPRLPNSICNMKSLSNLNLSGCSGVDKMLEDLPLSSSSGLCYLQYCLSFLEHLNPSGNNFESLSLKPFYSLKSLNISHCKRLQSLQEFPLPSRLQYLQAHQCISLKTLPTSNVVSTGNWNSQQSFMYSDCLKLDENARINIMADARLRIQVMATKAHALFEFSSVDINLQPIPNCKIKKCGVHLLYMEEESTQKSDDNSLNEAGLVENVEDQEDLNSKTLEETEHKSESEGKGRVKLMSKKIFVVGLALFFLVVVFIGKCK